MKVPSAIRQFNKHILNRLTGRIARSAYGPFAIVEHVGRRSGKAYTTPIIVVPMTGGFMVALTYGKNVDWYRNVVSAGRCRIQWHRQAFAIEQIESAAVPTALALFPLPERAVLRLLGIQDFVRMTYQTAGIAASV